MALTPGILSWSSSGGICHNFWGDISGSLSTSRSEETSPTIWLAVSTSTSSMTAPALDGSMSPQMEETRDMSMWPIISTTLTVFISLKT